MADRVIVGRNRAAVEFIRQAAGLPADVPALASVSEADVRGKIVYGNLPLNLASEAAEVIAIWVGSYPKARASLARYRVERVLGLGEGRCSECRAVFTRRRWKKGTRLAFCSRHCAGAYQLARIHERQKRAQAEAAAGQNSDRRE